MSALCSDKTGTLTKDEITLCQALDYAGADKVSVLKLATIDATIQGANGNNIDGAIVAHRLPDGTRVSVAQYKRVAVIPFTFERRRSASIVRGATGQTLLIVKGAFDEVLALCTTVREGGVAVGLDAARRRTLQQRADALNRAGFRVLLVAEKQLTHVDVDDEDGLHGLEAHMTLEGLISFIDPPKDDAAESIAQLKALGVEVKVLTGDSLPVALNVCRALRLVDADDADDDVQAMTGPQLAQLGDVGDDAFDEAVARCKVFAKLTPQQKALVVASLRDRGGHCVGMLGDGINDCMALRRADVGISVDSGANVAKDCADLILTEKGLGIIVSSVRIGRVTHGNTIKYIKVGWLAPGALAAPGETDAGQDGGFVQLWQRLFRARRERLAPLPAGTSFFFFCFFIVLCEALTCGVGGRCSACRFWRRTSCTTSARLPFRGTASTPSTCWRRSAGTRWTCCASLWCWARRAPPLT